MEGMSTSSLVPLYGILSFAQSSPVSISAYLAHTCCTGKVRAAMHAIAENRQARMFKHTAETLDAFTWAIWRY